MALTLPSTFPEHRRPCYRATTVNLKGGLGLASALTRDGHTVGALGKLALGGRHGLPAAEVRASMWQVSHSTVPPAAARNFSAETHITIRLINVPHTCERSGWNMGPDRQHYSPFGC